MNPPLRDGYKHEAIQRPYIVHAPPNTALGKIVEEDEFEASRKWFKDRMEHNLGYPVTLRSASRLHTWWRRALVEPVTFVTQPEEVQPLTRLIDWPEVFHAYPRLLIMDPCAGKRSILLAIAAELPMAVEYATFISNDINPSYDTDMHFDVMDPMQWASAPSDLDIIVSSVPWELADAILPDLVLRARLFCAFHVSSDWIANGPLWRRCWIAWLQNEGVLAEIRGLPRVKGRGTRRCTWLIIFASPEIKNMFWQPTLDCFTLFD